MNLEYLLGFATGSILVIIVYLTLKVLRKRKEQIH